MSATDKNSCCLCGHESKVSQDQQIHRVMHYDCPRCGTFVVNETELSMNSAALEKDKVRLSALTRERTIQCKLPFLLHFGSLNQSDSPVANTEAIEVHTLLLDWPTEFPDRLDRVLCNLARLSKYAGKLFPDRPADNALHFAQNNGEAGYIRNALEGYGWLDHYTLDNWRVAPEGWKRYSELIRTSGKPENPAFVAMWFPEPTDDDNHAMMKELYEKGIAPAIREAGYKPDRADIEPHNDYIMNKILGDIRIAPFVVADFTANRNGVYFEAGFARGLGIPVINTCKKSDFGEAHFDTKQLNHILWDTPQSLCEKLREHIRGTIGEGPYKSE